MRKPLEGRSVVHRWVSCQAFIDRTSLLSSRKYSPVRYRIVTRSGISVTARPIGTVSMCTIVGRSGPGLKGEKVLFRDPESLRQNLAPAIFQRRLGTERRQPCFRIQRFTILILPREHKTGLFRFPVSAHRTYRFRGGKLRQYDCREPVPPAPFIGSVPGFPATFASR